MKASLDVSVSSDLAAMVNGQSRVAGGGAQVRYPFATARPMQTTTMSPTGRGVTMTGVTRHRPPAASATPARPPTIRR
jgi:hypothetical protein